MQLTREFENSRCRTYGVEGPRCAVCRPNYSHRTETRRRSPLNQGAGPITSRSPSRWRTGATPIKCRRELDELVQGGFAHWRVRVILRRSGSIPDGRPRTSEMACPACMGEHFADSATGRGAKDRLGGQTNRHSITPLARSTSPAGTSWPIRQRPRPNAEIDGGEVSFGTPSLVRRTATPTLDGRRIDKDSILARRIGAGRRAAV
jgi:hypothetical protein